MKPESARTRTPTALPAALMAISLAAGVLSSLSCQPPRKPASPTAAGDRTAEPAPRERTASGVPLIRVRLLDSAAAAQVAVTGPHRVLVDGRPTFEAAAPLPAGPVAFAGDAWLLGGQTLRGRSLELVPTTLESLVVLDGRAFRGKLVLRAVTTGTFAADNHVDLESYLAGVLARELYPRWHEEAYKALAVTSRTYALYEMQNAGRSRGFDVWTDQRSQVYGGVADETDKSRAAVRATRGFVLVDEADDRIFKAYYSSTCGGVTNPADALEPQPNPAAPLAGGVICQDCAASTKYRWPPVRVRKEEVYRALVQAYGEAAAPMGGLAELRPATATSWGRVTWFDAVGPTGRSLRLRADDLRLALLRARIPAAAGLSSMNCTVVNEPQAILFTDGRGYGHGVGLCQWGAQGAAARGVPYHEILYHYYPRAKVIRAY